MRGRSRVRWAGWTSDRVFHAPGTRHTEGGTVMVVRSEADGMTRAIVEAQGRYKAVDAPSGMRMSALRAAADAERLCAMSIRRLIENVNLIS